MGGMYAIIAAIISFAITAVSGKWVIPFLKKLKYGQPIYDDGPSWHKTKEGTPTMGGIMFIIGIVIAVMISALGYFYIGFGDTVIGESQLSKIKVFAGLIMALAYGAIGFFDDYIKISKKRNMGLTSRQKFMLQVLVGIGYLVTLAIAGQRGITTIPLLGQIDLGLAYWPIALFMIVGFVNAVNLTDGVDGLCSTVAFFASIAFIIIASLSGFFGVSIMSSAIAGGALGFLLWNFHPAKIFMGDTGSLFLGGCMCAMAFGLDMPILLVPICIVYLIETLSVMLQVTYFKITKGKRLFKMSPIHHHFEMSGWSEVKIVTVAGLVTALFGVLSILLVYLGNK